MVLSARSLWYAPFLIGLILLGFLVHGPALKNPYYYDDIAFIQTNPWVGHGPGLEWYGKTQFDPGKEYGGYRPTLMLSYDWNAKIFGKTPQSFRFFNVLLHCLNAGLIFFLLFHAIRSRDNAQLISFFVAAIFLVHPTQTIAINFLWKRSTVLCVFFILVSLIFHSLARKKIGLSRLVFFIGEIFCVVLALTSNEMAVIYILLIAVYQFCFANSGLAGRALRIYFTTLGIVTAIFIYFRVGIIDELSILQHWNSNAPRPSQEFRNSLFRNISILGDYIVDVLFPRPLLIDDRGDLDHFPWREFGIVAIASTLLTYIGIKNKNHRLLVVAAATLFVIPLLPTNSFFSLHYAKDPIRLYLPIVAYALLITFSVHHFSPRLKQKRFFVLAMLTLLTAFGAVSLRQNLRYSDSTLIWNDVVTAYPNGLNAWNNLGMEYFRRGQFESARRAFEKSRALDPANPGHEIRVYLCKALSGESTRHHKDRLTQLPWKQFGTQDQIDLGALYFAMFEIEEAEAIFRHILHERPNVVSALMNLAQIQEAKQNPEEAKTIYHKVLTIDPSHDYARQRLSNL